MAVSTGLAVTLPDEQALAHWLADPAYPKALHSAKGPMLAVWEQGWQLNGLVCDTELVAYLLRPDQRSFDLADQPIIFAPDRNLGSYIQKLTGRENMVIWDGACHVHEEFSLEKILELKRQHPAAQVVVHPECRAYIVQVADFVGSTAAILDYCGKSSAREFIVVTEAGILTEMKRRYPEKTFIPAPPDDEACGCNNCRYMKMITLENIFTTLRDERPEISLDEEVRRRAERSILNMIAIK